MVGTFTPAMANIFKHNQSDCMEVTTMHGLKPCGIGRVVHITQACNWKIMVVKGTTMWSNGDRQPIWLVQCLWSAPPTPWRWPWTPRNRSEDVSLLRSQLVQGKSIENYSKDQNKMLYIDESSIHRFFHRQCESRGNGRSETSLTFLFEDTAAAKCGVERKEEVKYS